MDCEQCRELLEELILGRPDELSGAEKAQIEAHSTQCPACREERESLEAVAACVPTVEDIAGRIPEESLARARRRAMERVRAAGEEVSPARSLIRPWWIWTAAVAAGLILAAGFFRSMVVENEKTPAPEIAEIQDDTSEVSTAKKISELEKRFTAITDSHGAAKFLQEEYVKAKSDPSLGDFKKLIALCEKLIARWPDSRDTLEARQIISRCYTQLVEHDKARKAFLAYADAAGERTKAKADQVAAGIIAEEAGSFFGRQDYLLALSYYDVLLSRYPKTDWAYQAQYMTGRYYEAVGEPEEAIISYRRVLKGEGSNEALARQAYKAMSRVSFNAGDKTGALRALDEMAGSFQTDDDRAYAAFHAGMMQYARGEMYYPDALAKFSGVAKKYPGHRYARSAKGMIVLIQQKVIDEVMELKL